MSLQEKYQPVLDLGEEFGVKEGYVKEEEGVLKIGGVTEYMLQKNLMWDKIKEIGGEKPEDLIADIKISDESIYGKYTIQSGDTLGKIAKNFYGDAGKYVQIAAANNIENPDVIHPDQELELPNLD